MSNTAKDDIVVLGGREFKRTKNGLDEVQVASFINELIKERDTLAQSYEHITSLNRLAERTIVEADKLAKQIKTEATEQAKAESIAIIDKAKEEARQMSEKKIAEAVELANEQAKAIKAKAEEGAAKLLENEKIKIRAELRNLVNQQLSYMLEELENLKQQAAAVQLNFDNKLSQPKEENSAVGVNIAEKRDTTAVELAKESAAIVAEEIKKTLEEHPEPSSATNHIEKGFDLSDLLEIQNRAELGKPQWEVEILPPFEIAKIMEVVSFLDQLPEVANTEMIVPQIDMPSILVFLHESMNLIDVLQTIPAVAYVEKVVTDMDATNGKPKKVRIILSDNTASKEKN